MFQLNLLSEGMDFMVGLSREKQVVLWSTFFLCKWRNEMDGKHPFGCLDSCSFLSFVEADSHREGTVPHFARCITSERSGIETSWRLNNAPPS